MERRLFFQRIGQLTLGAAALSVVGCGAAATSRVTDEDETVTVYDVYAQALYNDGTMGPLTGSITAAQIAAGAALDLEFWHGHGGEQHRFVVSELDLARLKRGIRVYIETTPVDGHTHRLFIDPVLPQYRVPGKTPLTVPRSDGDLDLADGDSDGVADYLDRCSSTPPGSIAHKSGEWTGCAAGETPD